MTAECAAGVLPSKPTVGRDTQLAGALQATGGTLQAGVGGTMVYGGLSTCIPSLGVGCGVAAVGLYLGLSGVDTAVSGGLSVYDKKVHPTVGGSLIQMTGLSPGASELIYAGTQIGAGFSANRLLQPNNGAKVFASGLDDTIDLSVRNPGADFASRLVPRIDVTDEFMFKTGKNGRVTLQYGNPEGVHGLIVSVDRNGVLGFDIRAPKGGSSMSNASGTDMFLSAMQRLQQESIQVNAVRGTWIEGTDSVNAAQYLENLSKGLTPQQAAANTWTGKIAGSQGFLNVGVPETAHGTTTVHFGK